MKKKNEISKSVLYICFKNILSVAIFVYAAISFKLWWIALFSFLFQTGIRSSLSDVVSKTEDQLPSNLIRCSYCGEMLYVQDIQNAVHGEMKHRGWARIEIAGQWKNICPYCIAKYHPKLDNIQ